MEASMVKATTRSESELEGSDALGITGSIV